MNSDQNHKTRTLWLCGALHAFTHSYNVALLPLYLLIQKDLRLESVARSTLLVTVMMAAYFLPSYPMGILADRYSRKKLLGIGLAINGVGFMALACSPNYGSALASVILAGFGGSFYHPAATALVARLFPVNTGRAFGLIGIGASVGFLLSPIYTGWRATTAGWRTPVFELGLLGVIAAGLFAWLGQDIAPAKQRPEVSPGAGPAQRLFPTATLWMFFIGASMAFSLRDFAGSSMGSLGSLFLQHARDFDSTATGLALSAIFLTGIVGNPLFGSLSDRGRIRWISLVLVMAAIMIIIFPRVTGGWVLAVLVCYGFFFMASYPMVEAALMQSVPDAVRGRVFGLFITIAGLVGNLAHWIMGNWVKTLGSSAGAPNRYYEVYALLAFLVILSLAGLPCLHAIRKRERLEEGPLDAVPSPNAALRAPDSP